MRILCRLTSGNLQPCHRIGDSRSAGHLGPSRSSARRPAGIAFPAGLRSQSPTRPNTYEVAQFGHPDARVVYVDNDPVVFLHAESLMADHETTTVVRADLRDVDHVIAAAGKRLDFTQPVGLMFIACLHNSCGWK